MLIDFNELSEITIPNMNGGEGKVIAKMDVNDCGRFIKTVIPPKSSIGHHLQETNDDINFIVSGEGIAICDDFEEILKAGTCHVCPKGSTHSIINVGDEDLVFFYCSSSKIIFFYLNNFFNYFF